MGALLSLLALVQVLGGSSAPGAFSGGNGKIAFDNPGMAADELLMINPDTTGQAPVLGSPVNDQTPAWSPSGLQIAFARSVGGPSFDDEIWVVNADGTNPTQLTSGENDARPAFSGDGTKIVFSRSTGDSEIWVMNADGTGETQLTNDSVGQFEPVFNSAGTRIAYSQELGMAGNFADGVFEMDANGNGQAPLTPTDGSVSASSPDFSPDDSTLTFQYCEIVGEGCNGPHMIATMPAGGGQITKLTNRALGDPTDTHPVFSPDGAQIAFTTFDPTPQTSDIFRIPSGGGTVSPVTATGAADFADWQPVDIARVAGVSGENPGKCQGVAVTIHGSRGDDIINGTTGRDVIHGLRGDDVINGLEGDDRLCGGRGEDRIFGGPGNDVLFGGDGVDFLDGGENEDNLYGGTPKAPDKTYKDSCQGGKGKDKFKNCQKKSG